MKPVRVTGQILICCSSRLCLKTRLLIVLKIRVSITGHCRAGGNHAAATKTKSKTEIVKAEIVEPRETAKIAKPWETKTAVTGIVTVWHLTITIGLGRVWRANLLRCNARNRSWGL